MTNPTSNYGFVLPTSTDLVTDLPADFEVALQGVDTRLKALQPGTTLGDIAYSSATANTNTRLPIGTSGQVLAVSGGGVPAWTTTADVTPLTTKGDLFTYTTADARLGVGTDGQTLVADSTASTGLKWATPAAATSGLTLITRSTFSNVAGTNIDSVFSSTYKTYLVVIEKIYSATVDDDLQLQWRYGSSTQAASYYGNNMMLDPNNSAVAIRQQSNASAMEISRATGNSGNPLCGQFYVSFVGNASEQAMMNGISNQPFYFYTTLFGAGTTEARTYTGLRFQSSAANITGTVSVYGMATS